MSDYNSTYKRKRSRKKLSLDDAQLRMTDAIKRAEKIILDSDDDQKAIQAMNALSGLISRYSELIKTVELEQRLAALEERMNENSKLRKVR